MIGDVKTDSIARYDQSDLDDIVLSFRQDGVVVIDEVFSKERLQELHEHMKREYPTYFSAPNPDGDFYEVGQGRFTAPVHFAPPFDCGDVISSPFILTLLSRILTGKFVYEAFGVIVSLPGAPEQHVHRDGGMLFLETGIDRLLPPPAITVVIPLVDMDSISGTTAFSLGSHRSIERPEADAPLAACEIPAGSLIMWDFRVYHGGLANRGDVARPVLYLTACRPFWTDWRNFVPGKNAKLLASRAAIEALDEATRARFVRAELID